MITLGLEIETHNEVTNTRVVIESPHNFHPGPELSLRGAAVPNDFGMSGSISSAKITSIRVSVEDRQIRWLYFA